MLASASRASSTIVQGNACYLAIPKKKLSGDFRALCQELRGPLIGQWTLENRRRVKRDSSRRHLDLLHCVPGNKSSKYFEVIVLNCIEKLCRSNLLVMIPGQ
jgi:hypothetical protein